MRSVLELKSPRFNKIRDYSENGQNSFEDPKAIENTINSLLARPIIVGAEYLLPIASNPQMHRKLSDTVTDKLNCIACLDDR